MKRPRYYPFDDKKDMVRCALADAISWEESRLDAGCDIGNPVAEQECKDRIKAYRKELNRMQPGATTAQDRMDAELDAMLRSGEAEMLTLEEIKERASRQSGGGSIRRERDKKASRVPASDKQVTARLTRRAIGKATKRTKAPELSNRDKILDALFQYKVLLGNDMRAKWETPWPGKPSLNDRDLSALFRAAYVEIRNGRIWLTSWGEVVVRERLRKQNG